MLVYRVCTSEEYSLIINNENCDNLGRFFSNEVLERCNTHMYQSNKRYLHFFPRIDSIFYLDILVSDCICVYDIPDSILNLSKGLGFYTDRFNKLRQNTVFEYAIVSDLIKKEYLKKIYVVKDSIYIEMDQNRMTKSIELVYDSNINKELIKKKVKK